MASKTDETPASDDVIEGTVVSDITSEDGEPEYDAALTAWLSGAGGEVSERTTDPMARIIQQVMDAETPDAVLTPVEVQQARDLVNVPLVIMDFELNKSEYDAGSPFYASMVCGMPPDGEPAVVNCGHRKVIAQLVRLKQLGGFPVSAKFIERGKSKQGTAMLELTKWSDSDGPPPF